MNEIFPASFIEFPVSTEEGRSASFYLAAEEYLAQEMPEGNYVFFWQLNPTCVFGRHQNPALELDLDFCRRHGVDIVRRKSGGGTIFANKDNIMVSLVTGKGSVETVFNAFSHEIARCLKQLGAPMKVSGRNDICLEDGRKICGGAFYHMKDRNIVHCTMLYDTDMEMMRGCLTPARAKLESKGVKSVPSRIGLLKEFFPFGVEELRHRLGTLLTNRTLRLSAEQVARIEVLEQPYHTAEYIFGKSGRHSTPTTPIEHTFTASRRIEGCGRVEIALELAATGTITDVHLSGDFFETGERPAEEAFREALCGLPLRSADITEALRRHKPERTIRGLSAEALEEILGEPRRT